MENSHLIDMRDGLGEYSCATGMSSLIDSYVTEIEDPV